MNDNDAITWFRQTNRYAATQGFAAGMPSFDRAKRGNSYVYGMYLLASSMVEWRDVHWSELFPRSFPLPGGEGKPADFQAWFRAVNRYADRQGFAAGFPTFEQANYGVGTVYGMYLLKQDVVRWQDVRKADLEAFDPANPAAWFRAANHWAYRHGFPFGFPTYETAVYPAPKNQVFGVTGFTGADIEFRDVAESVLFPSTPPTPPTSGIALAGLGRPDPQRRVFIYEGSSNANNPAGKITRLTSQAINTAGNGMELLLSYRDNAGRTKDRIDTLTSVPTDAFDGLNASGFWTAQAINISAALLPQILTLDLEWHT